MKKRSAYLIIILVCVVVLMIPSLSVFAQDGGASSELPPLSNVKKYLEIVVSILSWIWIPIANLAGKLMTNSMVNGEVFKLSSFFFQVWSVMRIVANTIILWVILYLIYTIATSGKVDEPSKKITKIIGTSLLVNISRWLLAAMVDLSSLAVFGVSNVWYSIINSAPSLKGNIAVQMNCLPKEITFDLGGGVESYKKTIDEAGCANGRSIQSSLDQILPTYDDMSWPFMYFGRGVFRLFEFMDTSVWSAGSDGSNQSLQSIVISFSLKLFLMMMFVTPLIALLVVNLARVFLIRLWFMLGPLIAVKRWLSWMWIDRIDTIDDHWYLDINNIVWALMTPAVVTWTLFLSIIMIAGLFGWLARPDLKTGVGAVVGGVQKTYNEVEQNRLNENFGITVDGRSISVPWVAKTTFNGDIINDSSKYIFGSFGYLIICVMTMGLMWAIFRVWLSTSKLLSGIGKTVMDGWKAFLTKGIQLPVWVDGAPVSLDQLHEKLWLKERDKRINENYIKPIEKKNLRKLEEKVADTALWRALWYEVSYNKSISFKPDEKVKKTFAGKGHNQFDESNNEKRKSMFELSSASFFKELNESLDEKGTVKWGNEIFKSNIISWLEWWWVEYLQYKKILSTDKEKLKKRWFLSEGGKWDYDAIVNSSKTLGKTIEELMKKGAAPNNSKEFVDKIGKIYNEVRSWVDDNASGKEYPKLTLKH